MDYDFLTTKECAKLLRCTVPMVHIILKNHPEITVTRLGRKILVHVEPLDNFLQTCTGSYEPIPHNTN